MSDHDLLARIEVNPAVLAGKPIIKGTRLSVEYIVNLLAHGATGAEILSEYRELDPEDVQACLLFASKSLEGTVILPFDALAV